MITKSAKYKFYILISAVGLLTVVSIFLSIETAVTGATISALEKQEKLLTNQKRDLESALVKSLSNSELEEKSVELGFVKSTNLVYINAIEPVAKLP